MQVWLCASSESLRIQLFCNLTGKLTLVFLLRLTCADRNFGELFDDVGYNVQSAPSPVAHLQDKDRLEQDNCVQNCW